MAYIHDIPARPKPRIASPWDVVLLAWNRACAAYTVRRNRHEIERMLQFDTALLDDIGVSRGDVVQALTTDDPSATLAGAARERSRR